MKKIKINNKQFNKLFESDSAAIPDLNNGDLKEYPNSEVFTTANVATPDGNVKYGKPTQSDKIQSTLSVQNYWLNSHSGQRPTS